jgi:hypothetical protein
MLERPRQKRIFTTLEGFNVRVLPPLISFDVSFLNVLSYIYHLLRVVGLTLNCRMHPRNVV